VIAGLLAVPLVSRVLPEGEGVTGDGDRPASLHEPADEFQTDSAATGGNNEEQQQ